LFDSFADHPRIKFWPNGDRVPAGVKPAPYSYTTAAGAPQITESTWNDFIKAKGRHDFSRESQIDCCVWLFEKEGAYDDIVYGRLEAAVWIGQSPRHLAQTLGTEWGRATVREDIWVRATEQLLESQGLEANRIVVIPDVRFENEAAFVRKHGLLIHLYRDGADGQVGIQGHASESGVIPQTTDLAITNNGSLDDLYGKLGAIFPRPVR
jgi:hypothetical protein